LKLTALILLLILLSSPAWATNWCDSASPCHTIENGSGTELTDSSSTGNDGTFTGAGEPAWYNADTPDTYSSWAVDFDGSDDMVTFDSTVTMAEDESIVVWFNSDDVVLANLFGRTADSVSSAWIWSATEIRVIAIDGSSNDFTVPTISTGTWYHLAVTKDSSSNYRVFQDGTESSSGAWNDASDLTQITNLGRGWNNNDLIYNGRLDEFAKITSQLDSTDINDIIDNGLVGGQRIPTSLELRGVTLW